MGASVTVGSMIPWAGGSRPRGSPRTRGSVRVRVGSGMSRIGGRSPAAHCGPMQTAQDRDVPPSGGLPRRASSGPPAALPPHPLDPGQGRLRPVRRAGTPLRHRPDRHPRRLRGAHPRRRHRDPALPGGLGSDPRRPGRRDRRPGRRHGPPAVGGRGPDPQAGGGGRRRRRAAHPPQPAHRRLRRRRRPRVRASSASAPPSSGPAATRGRSPRAPVPAPAVVRRPGGGPGVRWCRRLRHPDTAVGDADPRRPSPPPSAHPPPRDPPPPSHPPARRRWRSTRRPRRRAAGGARPVHRADRAHAPGRLAPAGPADGWVPRRPPPHPFTSACRSRPSRPSPARCWWR